MYSLLTAVYTECRYLIWPHLCASCKLFLRSERALCSSCERSISPIMSVPIKVTKKVTMHVYAVSAYQRTVKRLIMAKNWREERAAVVLGSLLWDNTPLPFVPFDVIVPVPLHWHRFAQRGFNQAELMAQELSKKSGKPVCLALTSIRRTQKQESLYGKARVANVKGAFALTGYAKEHLKGKHVLIVDDLMASGSTLQAAAKVINRCRPETIKSAVGGRVV